MTSLRHHCNYVQDWDNYSQEIPKGHILLFDISFIDLLILYVTRVASHNHRIIYEINVLMFIPIYITAFTSFVH